MKRIFWACALLLVACGCASIEKVGLSVVYRQAQLPAPQIHRDLPYNQSGSPKNRLDLFCAAGTNWPVLIFIYGGGWTNGDKSLAVAGDDVYGNIGRFYAQHGIGVAVVNYRLLPEVTWRDQLTDVAQATAWVHQHIAAYGGNPDSMFLMGHSAGGQIAARLALDDVLLAQAGCPPEIIRGAICVSGAGLDMTDQETYALGESPDYFASIFAQHNEGSEWQKIGSPATYAHRCAPPFLILYAGGETKALIRQAQHFNEILDLSGVTNRLVEVPGQSHSLIVLTLSRDDKTSGPAILEFIETTQRK